MNAREHRDLLAQRARETVLVQVGRTQAEDQRAQLGERLARELAHPFELSAGGIYVAVEQRRGRVGAEVEAEQLLADDVVQLQREPVALGQDRQLPAALVQARVGDRDRCVCGEQLDQLLVELVERVGALLFGQIEGADDLVAGPDRNSEERPHVRVPARPPAAEAGIVVDVLRAVGAAGLEHRAEHPVGARQRAHRLDQLVAHPGDQKAPESAAPVRDPERRIARAGELARRVHEPLQYLVD